MAVKVSVEMNITRTILAQARQAASEIVRKTALDLSAQAKQRSPVDTGYNRASIVARKVNDLTYQVSVGSEYGFYLEYGTYKMAPQPYFNPAIEHVAPSFEAAMRATFHD